MDIDKKILYYWSNLTNFYFDKTQRKLNKNRGSITPPHFCMTIQEKIDVLLSQKFMRPL